ncbi:preprotein translocase subunit SecB [Rhizomicrobium palustre]|jgi:preprotein translocase subunit SecB|uniref:Protein-export protein SecB n=1 Tax=Rhizomicrobium palustre TaxID=189966 RepID=A0A846MX88_9PROT|nr:protein-export chaperone SecB [Rhizomicrobium palustre]NIK88174.1 preprotein translocase subunit SecB [Rhizomicrobium palustre]
MADELPPDSAANGLDTDAPRVQVIGQFIKDLSFENPGIFAGQNARPQIELNVDLQARQVDTEVFEVELKLRVSAKNEERALFLLELVYGGLFQLHNIPDEVRQQVLLIEAPHVLFPFARRIVADVVRDGGMPPLMIEPIDFAALYRSKLAQMQQAPVAQA